ncbi:hypothetical protein EXIGLDRAFT_724076 [Exidia glandulosa HHB12029]|uniref:VWFA domain-containing protein n=1 Tax=Exidia glandulosa HHB12029 TaxID=1314781 RepID=A0A165EK43_EXIGL|nr:hypothetical protein EXIGLDRAFT_724076 [Exidia glandulosa HHB12029]
MDTDAPPPFSNIAPGQSGPAEPPSYEATPSEVKLSVVSAEKGGDVLISLAPPREPLADKNVARAPADICCVIDVSGSMDDAATMPDEEGKQTATELSILDVVRHAMRTIMATLGPQDRMAVVAFTDRAYVESDLIFMDDAGKTAMEKVIVSLKPLGSTNLWDGLKTGMDLLNDLYKGPEAEPMPSPYRDPVPPQSPIGSGTVNRLKNFWSSKGKARAQYATPEPEKVEPETAPPVNTEPVLEVDRTRVRSIFLLTDGMPNVHPPSGELQAFKKYLDAHPATFTVSTFGFGYALDSQLLLKLATTGGGQYSFIPDSGMVGTIFVHAVANALATYAPTSTLAIEAEGKLSILGDIKHIETSWGVQIDFGDIMYGQTRDIVVRAEDPMSVKVSVTASFTPWTDHEPVSVRGTAAPEQDASARADIKYHRRRLELVSALLDASKAAPDDEKIQAFKTIAQSIRKDADLANHKHALALVEDVEGQILLAVENPEYWKKWGRHYLPSLARAHQRQHCVNFKDPGQLIYGADSPVFITARDALDSAFDDIPPPKPSRQTYGGPRGVQVSSMSAMNSSYGPCVDGSCTVDLVDGSALRVDALRRGHVVQTAAGPRAVVAIVRTAMPHGVNSLCTLPGGLRVTPWHPIRLAGGHDWVFPADVVPEQVLPCDAVYSILLEREDGNADAHAIRVNGVDVIALGHGVHTGILDHDFFATYDNVVRSIAALTDPADDSGVVHSLGVVRGGAEGRVQGFVPMHKATSTSAWPVVSDTITV